MSLLAKFRLSPRWLILLIGFAALAVTSAALIPHDEGSSEDIDCLVCKAGQKPLTELSADLVAAPHLALTSSAPGYQKSASWSPLVESGSPRAPPL